MKGHRQSCKCVRIWGTLFSQMLPAEVAGQFEILKERLGKFQLGANSKP